MPRNKIASLVAATSSAATLALNPCSSCLKSSEGLFGAANQVGNNTPRNPVPYHQNTLERKQPGVGSAVPCSHLLYLSNYAENNYTKKRDGNWVKLDPGKPAFKSENFSTGEQNGPMKGLDQSAGELASEEIAAKSNSGRHHVASAPPEVDEPQDLTQLNQSAGDRTSRRAEMYNERVERVAEVAPGEIPRGVGKKIKVGVPKRNIYGLLKRNLLCIGEAINAMGSSEAREKKRNKGRDREVDGKKVPTWKWRAEEGKKPEKTRVKFPSFKWPWSRKEKSE